MREKYLNIGTQYYSERAHRAPKHAEKRRKRLPWDEFPYYLGNTMRTGS
jgi:hypothetical protein